MASDLHCLQHGWFRTVQFLPLLWIRLSKMCLFTIPKRQCIRLGTMSYEAEVISLNLPFSLPLSQNLSREKKLCLRTNPTLSFNEPQLQCFKVQLKHESFSYILIYFKLNAYQLNAAITITIPRVLDLLVAFQSCILENFYIRSCFFLQGDKRFVWWASDDAEGRSISLQQV